MSEEKLFGVFSIEKGIKLPTAQKTKGPKKFGGYPFGDMEIGDSFKVDIPQDKCSRSKQSNIAARAYDYANAIGDGRKYTTRKLREDGVWVLRCWRVA